MNALIQGFDWLIYFFREIWETITSLFNALILAFKYFINIVDLSLTTIDNLPDWLYAFAILTVVISAIYFVVGREAGKN